MIGTAVTFNLNHCYFVVVVVAVVDLLDLNIGTKAIVVSHDIRHSCIRANSLVGIASIIMVRTVHVIPSIANCGIHNVQNAIGVDFRSAGIVPDRHKREFSLGSIFKEGKHLGLRTGQI